MAVLSMQDEVIFDRGKLFFRSNNKFQNKTTSKYRPFNNEVTKSLSMGFVGIDEGKKQGAGAVVLDLLLKSRMMTAESNHQWKMTLGGKNDRNYMCGDRTSIGLFQVFWNGISSRGNTHSQASTQCEEFDKALSRLVAVTGDWHTGLDMG